MTERQITPPAALAVTLEAAKANMRIDGSDMDALVTGWLEGVTDYAEHAMGRAIISQSWSVVLPVFPSVIELIMPPIVSVASVKYFDIDGVLQTMDATGYVLDAVSEPGYLVPAPGTQWPATALRINAVTIEYTCGYGDTADSTPAGIRLFILAKLAEQFDPAVSARKQVVQTSFIDHLLDRYKVYSL